MASRDRARARGRALERRLAERLGGLLWAGEKGDLVVGEWVVEAKYRRGYRLDRIDQLKSWVAQAKGNLTDARHGRAGRTRWLLCLYGGPGTEYLAILPLAEFQRLTGLAPEGDDVDQDA